MKMHSSQAIAVVGRRFPGMMPNSKDPDGEVDHEPRISNRPGR